MGAFEPDVRGVLAAGIPDPQFVQRIGNHLGVVTVIVDVMFYLFLSFGREHRSSAALNDIRHAVKLGGLTAQPQFIEAGLLRCV